MSFKQPVKKVCVLQWRVGEGPRRSSCDLNNFQMEEERQEKDEEDFCALDDSFYTECNFFDLQLKKIFHIS